MSYKLTKDHMAKFKKLLKTHDNLVSLMKDRKTLQDKNDNLLNVEIRALSEKIRVEKESLIEQLTHDEKDTYFTKVFWWDEDKKKRLTDQLKDDLVMYDAIERLEKFKEDEFPKLKDLEEEFEATQSDKQLLKKENIREKRSETIGPLTQKELKREEKNKKRAKRKHRKRLKDLMLPSSVEGGRRTRGKKRGRPKRKSRRRKRTRKRRKSKGRKRRRKNLKKRTKRRR